jgi:hypothetical protein
VDRDGRGKPPSDEFGSFDLSKMSEAEVAAELAARMARWRDARKSAKAAPRAPAGEHTAQPPTTRAPAAQASAAHPPIAQPLPTERSARRSLDRPPTPRELDPGVAARLDAALRLATPPRPLRPDSNKERSERPASYGMAFETLLAEGLNPHAAGMGAERPVDQTLVRQRARYLPAQERAIAGRALMRALATHAERMLERLGLLAAGAHAAARAAWRACKPALERRAGDARRHARTLLDDGRRAAIALTAALAARIEQASGRARMLGHEVRRFVVTARRESKPRLAILIPRLAQSVRAFPRAARRLAADRLVIASTAAIAVAIAGWLLTLPEAAAPPEAAHGPALKKAPASTEARAIAASAEPGYPPQPQRTAQPLRPAEPRPSETASIAITAMLKPVVPAPTLPARLKPGTPSATLPTTGAEGDAPAAAGEQEQTTDAPNRTDDPRAIDDMLNRMFSDGLGRSLSRQKIR